uniref:C17orf113 probable zinc finger domain-containing protein n=1 Tax=Maylandia zebra TaxID=106582 RepID=A0A3P9BE87_9CICH
MMFCRVCREFPSIAESTSAFVTGTSNFRKDPIRTHEKSLHHKKCIDTGIIEQELVHVRYVRDNGDIATYMIKCQPVKSANAAGILEAIDEAVNTMGIREDTWKKKVVCANFDGAAVMMGEKTGVAGRLKQRIPHIITIHCVAHKLELAVLDSVKGCEYLVKFEDTLKTIFKMYYYSPKKRRELTEISELLNERLAHFSGLKSTRWLPSRLRCLKAVEKNYTPTVVHMENMAEGSDVKAEDAAKAKGVVQEMKTEKFVRFLHFMLDYSTILRLGRVPQLWKTSCVVPVPKTSHPKDLNSYRPVALTSHLMKTLERLYMDNRFKNLHEKPLSCFKVFDPSTLPYPREELANYGDEEVDYLVTHFACLLDAEEKEKIPQEWMDLKVWLAERRGRKVDCLYRDLLSENPEHLSHILLLVKLMLTLSPSTMLIKEKRLNSRYAEDSHQKNNPQLLPAKQTDQSNSEERWEV